MYVAGARGDDGLTTAGGCALCKAASGCAAAAAVQTIVTAVAASGPISNCARRRLFIVLFSAKEYVHI
jgi:hypothetical protein